MPRNIYLTWLKAVGAHLHTWECSFSQDAVERIIAIRSNLARDEQFAALRSKVHRPRRDPRLMSDHVKILLEEYSPIVRRCLDAGFTIRFIPDGRPSLAIAQVTTPEDWSFNAATLQAEATAVAWPDKELIAFLTFGTYDYSADTPPVSWFAPHNISVYKHWKVFADSVSKEIGLGWMHGPHDFIPTIPFRVVPGAAIPKKRQPQQVSNDMERVSARPVNGLQCGQQR